ncbi:MAG: tRNA 2-selenouridine(34) synthase MnmH [Gammaproteobacteria bacterium]|nr:tRNA 2-selenouridine(34) synthase MnmH [Gammaproteobacteria bacterium]MBU0771872.1 tRNA 2-selenouridine(34) synthase MnmH [Gammaproteobacteria bacterium]MBU0856107.1 tRNA 2-selenouridine(34) synthase MnmH [Gammaproteobacteria bacterium]MBU1846190.1 tRNA 2-selenouridine(34) synthase MnmH [Gammaproteobacteria bacterium]
MTETSGQRRPAGLATVAQLRGFDAIIDTRSPAEFALDHIPGAINCPALDDAQRAEIGTLYKQVSPFVAKRRGAALVALNIGRHLLDSFQDKGPQWRPLIYCWRGGRRSGAFVTVLRQIGWDAHQLEGGYKNYRRDVLTQLSELPARFDFHVLSGPTGSAKSRVLERLTAHGEQVLDLEALAAHKGSVLGNQPGQPQPPQKMFESHLLERLKTFDPARPVFAEAESRRIGRISLPDSLIDRLRTSPCIRIDAPAAARTEFLLGDYTYLTQDADNLIECLQRLTELRGRATIDSWSAMARDGQWRQLVASLLELHYDPLYRRSQQHNFARHPDAPTICAERLDAAGIDALAARIAACADQGSRNGASPPTAQMR